MLWVDEQYQLDPRSKFILHKLALYADADCRSWAKVEVLATGTNSSIRTVQGVLKRFRQTGLIRDTSDEHTLNPGSRYPRKVPIFQMAPGIEGIDPQAKSSGAEIAPEPALGCKSEHAGAQLVAPRNEHKGTYSPSDEGETHAPERDARFIRLEQAYPKRGLGFTNRGRAWAVFSRLSDEGLDVELLIQAAAAFAADRAGKRTEQGLEYWLDDRKYRGWWPEPQLAFEDAKPTTAQAHPNAAPAEDQAIWQQVRDRLAAGMTEGEFGTWVKPAFLGRRGDRLFVVSLTAMARDWIKGRCWRRVEAAWAECDGGRRGLLLVAKSEFEAGFARQTEGVG